MKKLLFLIFFLSSVSAIAAESQIIFNQENGACKLQFKAEKNPSSNEKTSPFIFGYFKIYTNSGQIKYEFQANALKESWKKYFEKDFNYLKNLESVKILNADFTTSCKANASNDFIENYKKVTGRNFDCVNSKQKAISAQNSSTKTFSSQDIYLFANLNPTNSSFQIEIETEESKKAFYDLNFNDRKTFYYSDFFSNNLATTTESSNFQEITKYKKCRDILIFDFIKSNFSIEELVNPIAKEY